MLQKRYEQEDYDKLDQVSKDRLDEVWRVIDEKFIRFPNATLTENLKRGKGEVSVYLNAKKPMSKNFYESFIKHYGRSIKEKAPIEVDADLRKEIGKLNEIVLNHQATINVLLKAFGNVSSEEIDKETGKLLDELRRLSKDRSSKK